MPHRAGLQRPHRARLQRPHRAGLQRPHSSGTSQQAALPLPLPDRLRPQDGAHRLVKHLFESALGERRALEVFDGPDLVSELLALLALHRGVAVLRERLQGLLVLPQVNLRPYQKHGRVGAVVLDLRAPLGGDVLEGGGRYDGETDEEDVRLWVGERPEPVVVLLAGRVPEAQGHGHPVTHHGRRVVVKHCGHVLPGEAVGGVADEHAGLAHGAVPHHHTLDRPPRRHRANPPLPPALVFPSFVSPSSCSYFVASTCTWSLHGDTWCLLDYVGSFPFVAVSISRSGCHCQSYVSLKKLYQAMKAW